ncbi:MAG: DUF4417 domain-containing protein [Propionicimonas sp.]
MTFSETQAVPPLSTRDRRDVINGRLLDGLTLVGYYEIPKTLKCTEVPERLVAFTEAVSKKNEPDPDAWVHFYEDDYKFTRLWARPEKYYERLGAYAGVISPDYSLYRNMPTAQQIGHTYQNQLLGARLQADGVHVIANVRLSGPESIAYALAGVPPRSTLALGLNGCTKEKENRAHVIEEIRLICDSCEPTSLVVYGSDEYGVLDYPLASGIAVHVYPPDTLRRSKIRAAA